MLIKTLHQIGRYVACKKNAPAGTFCEVGPFSLFLVAEENSYDGSSATSPDHRHAG